MLDGIQREERAFRAVKIHEYEDGKAVKLTINFTALNAGEAQRFLDENGYDGYKLTDDAPTAR